MIAEGKVICPWCGQGEVVRFRMDTVKYITSDYSADRSLQVTVHAQSNTPHNCSVDKPGRKGSKYDY